MRYLSFIILLFIQYLLIPEARSQKAQSQAPSVPVNYSSSPSEIKLFNMINEYRSGYNLPPIPVSRSLSYVASLHVKDLYNNHPDQAPCNFHSWSNRGQWKPFCYPRDEKKNNSVWDKPKELTGYNGKGYEIIYWENNPVNIDSIIPFWSSIDYFNSFLLNTGKWQDKKWMALGIGIYENYASAWFGELPDVEDKETTATVSKEQEISGESIKPKEPVKLADSNRMIKPIKPAKPIKPKSEKKTVAPVIVASPDSLKVTEISKPTTGRFFIIISSQQPLLKSNQLAAELIGKGYPDAKVLAKDNKVRVSIVELPTKAKADSALREIKKIFIDSWILKQ